MRTEPFCFPAGSYFVLSMLDRLWHPDLSEAEALALHEKGIAEVQLLHSLTF